MVSFPFSCLIYFMFFLSGAAALIYQVVWVRSLTLIFGGSHLAVTAVLSIFMAGLGVGGYWIGKYVDHFEKPLRLYGLLELGTAIFAVIFMGLMNLYPSIYVSLAQGKDHAPIYLSFIRIMFSTVALIIPTVLMGGTLPVLAAFISGHPKNLRSRLSFLYGFNTFGAVAGATVAGFLLLRFYSLSTTLYVAVLTNLLIGFSSILLQERVPPAISLGAPELGGEDCPPDLSQTVLLHPETHRNLFPFKLVLWGIGISGFCALGYEVLWTRILTIAMGASVYGFTTMLVAFLMGIALGSEGYGLFPRIFRTKDKGPTRSVFWFGIVQMVIGLSALLVTLSLRYLPAFAIRLQNYFSHLGLDFFGVRVWSNFALAFFFMIIPAFFMGLAFPLAGKVHAEYKRGVGGAVGQVLAYNTLGAILGAAISGFAMIYLFGIGRSLQMLIGINIGFGLLAVSSLKRIPLLQAGISGFTVSVLLFLALTPHAFRMWDTKYFAIFRNNQPEAFRTPEMIQDVLENTDVLYYGEGVEAIVSAIKVKGGEQSFITNGRIEASTHLQGQQVMFALSHLPMLLHPNPRNVLVVGLGSGMTLGAISVHPSVDKLTLVEIEPKVLGVARTFENYNHHVLDNPKLKIVFNDGRNLLLTTKMRYDVITADPIHPWFRGAGYLYTKEYFKLAAERLSPGGIICQWLPLYELTTEDLKSIVATFLENFRYAMLWLTHYDAELIGSNSPIIINEEALERRIAEEPIASDLKRVMMGSANDLLSYFATASEGMKAFSEGGIINTDNNLYLEFSAPQSIARASVMEANVQAIMRHRESILPHLAPARNKGTEEARRRRWAVNGEAAEIAGRALAIFLGGRFQSPEFKALLGKLVHNYPDFAPGRFLESEYLSQIEKIPRLLQKTAFNLLDAREKRVVKEISAVLAPVSKHRAAVMFVDNQARVIYGQRYFSGADKDERITRFVDEVMLNIRSAYYAEARTALTQGRAFPQANLMMAKIRQIIESNVKGR